ncbi:hypothetical protein B4135_1012 [Caldibacillus debilis]|uniref:Uncharacterized protein n=1 Tax=Caldibacillus debilis TaxID=301148 RepID=A0A150MES7_9BACI|nr:hypothetical protein B4135_1012 [Caldibacillus debilis]
MTKKFHHRRKDENTFLSDIIILPIKESRYFQDRTEDKCR